MKKCRITVMRISCYDDLIEKYENPMEHACDLKEGQVFVANGWEKPEGLCNSAWESMSPFVMALAHGGENFYDGWMKNPKSAMISCNDGFRPVSFYIEALEEDACADNFKIREMTAEDNAAVAELVRTNLKKHNLDIPGTVYFDSSLDNLYDFYANNKKRGYYVLTDENERVVGGIGLAEFAPFEDCAELQKLYLDDSVKGLGLGYRLIRFVEDKMKEKGYKASYLETHDNLKAAIHIYEKSGYSKIERPNEVVHGAMNNFFYKKLF